jgi:hypothetical protein
MDVSQFDHHNRNEVPGDEILAKWAARVKKYLDE